MYFLVFGFLVLAFTPIVSSSFTYPALPPVPDVHQKWGRAADCSLSEGDSVGDRTSEGEMEDLEEEPLSLEQQEASLREYTQQYEEVIDDWRKYTYIFPTGGKGVFD